MHIERRIGIGWGELNVLVPRLRRKAAERRQQMAVARESRRVQDGRGRMRLRLLLLHVFPSRAMTFFALDAERKSSVAIAVGWRGKPLKIGCVTLQATRNDGAIEIGEAVAIAGAVHPA